MTVRATAMRAESAWFEWNRHVTRCIAGLLVFLTIPKRGGGGSEHCMDEARDILPVIMHTSCFHVPQTQHKTVGMPLDNLVGTRERAREHLQERTDAVTTKAFAGQRAAARICDVPTVAM